MFPVRMSMVLAGLFVFSSASLAAWGPGGNGVPAASFPSGLLEVTDVQVLPDGAGGAYILWRDTRNGNGCVGDYCTGDIFLQRVTGSGEIAPGWPNPGPLVICDEPGDQVQPSMCRDGSAGVYVCWSDGRVGNVIRDIYVQRITPSGTIAFGWPEDGKAVCTFGNLQDSPQIACRGNGAVVAWADHRFDLTGLSLFAQRLSSAGQTLWTQDGVHIFAFDLHLSHWEDFSIASDLDGDAILAWTSTDQTLHLTRRNALNGACVWGCPDAPAVDTDCERPVLRTADDGDIDLLYSKAISFGNRNLYYQRLTPDGSFEVAIPVSSTNIPDFKGTMVSEPTGGVVFGWWDQRLGGSDLRPYAHRAYGGQMMSPSCWTPGGTPMTTVAVTPQDGQAPAFASDLHGGALAVFQHGDDLYVRHVLEDASADPAFPGTGLPMCSAPGVQHSPVVTTVASGKIVSAWIDRRDGIGNPAVFVNEMAFTTPAEVPGVTDLGLESIGPHTAGIYWTEPPSNPTYGAPTHFEIRQGVTIDIIPAQGIPGSPYCYGIFGLDQCNIYNFEVRTIFGCGHLSFMSSVQGVTPCSPEDEIVPCETDPWPPSAVTDLSAAFDYVEAFVQWTEPGGDGSQGNAAQFEIRRKNVPITAANWATAQIVGSGSSQPAGTHRSVTVPVLSCQWNYLALKSVDLSGNWSAISNVVAGRKCCTTPSCGTTEAKEAPRSEGTPRTVELAISSPQRGPGVIRYGIPSSHAGDAMELAVFDLIGRRAGTLAQGVASPGWFEVRWDSRSDNGSRIVPGVYFLRLRLGDATIRRKVTFIP